MQSDNQESNIHHHPYQQTYYRPEDDFISLRDMIKSILKHWRKIAVFTCAATVLAAAVFVSVPKKYGAEAVLQVVMPEAIGGQVPNQAGHEANLRSHLECLKSSAVVSLVADALKKRGVEMSVRDLLKAVKIDRPSGTNLLKMKADARSEEDALAIVKAWRDEYLNFLSANSVNRAILTLQSLVSVLQSDWLEKSGKAEEMRKHAEENERDKIVTLSKTIEEGELWRRLLDGADAEQLKKLSDIHFQSQEINEAHLIFKKLQYEAEQEAASTRKSLDFYRKVLDVLRGRTSADSAPADRERRMIEDYAKMLLEKRDVFAMGEPAVIEVRRGAAAKTAVTFFAALFAACAAAFMFEWLRESPL